MSPVSQQYISRARANRAGRVLAALIATAAVGACHESLAVAPDAVAAHLVVVSGDLQAGRVTETALAPVSVEVRDQRGVPMSGAIVRFATTGNAAFNDAAVVSDSEGVASALFTFGTREGDYHITAAVDGIADTVRFTLHANPDPPHTLAEVSGDAQSEVAGAALDAPLMLAVTDEFGNAIAGVTVTWSVTGGGSLSAPTSVTDDDGVARVQLTLGSSPGTEVVTAHVDNVQEVSFLATAR